MLSVTVYEDLDERRPRVIVAENDVILHTHLRATLLREEAEWALSFVGEGNEREAMHAIHMPLSTGDGRWEVIDWDGEGIFHEDFDSFVEAVNKWLEFLPQYAKEVGLEPETAPHPRARFVFPEYDRESRWDNI